jgi:hypothetical protein
MCCSWQWWHYGSLSCCCIQFVLRATHCARCHAQWKCTTFGRCGNTLRFAAPRSEKMVRGQGAVDLSNRWGYADWMPSMKMDKFSLLSPLQSMYDNAQVLPFASMTVAHSRVKPFISVAFMWPPSTHKTGANLPLSSFLKCPLMYLQCWNSPSSEYWYLTSVPVTHDQLIQTILVCSSMRCANTRAWKNPEHRVVDAWCAWCMHVPSFNLQSSSAYAGRNAHWSHSSDDRDWMYFLCKHPHVRCVMVPFDVRWWKICLPEVAQEWLTRLRLEKLC